MGQRKKARELALKCLYAIESVGQSVESIDEHLIAGSELGEDAQHFARRLFEMTVIKTEELDQKISQHSEHWRIERMAMVDKNILRLSICELLYFPDIPARVAVNEGVELAKKYSSHESSRFVNGILDAVLKHIEEVESTKRA